MDPADQGRRPPITLCRAGICAEDFEAHIGELRAACYARDARVTRNRSWSQLVTIDIIRRDKLAAKTRHHPRCCAPGPAAPAALSPAARIRRSPAQHREPDPAHRWARAALPVIPGGCCPLPARNPL